jgi:hypothetical protein
MSKMSALEMAKESGFIQENKNLFNEYVYFVESVFGVKF